MYAESTKLGRLVMVRLDSGDDILQAIRAAVAQEAIRNGVILGALGSINSFHIHIVETPNLPPRDVFLKGDGPYDILSLNGVVLDGRIHAHITFSNTEKAMGGHLEEGCRTLSFGVVTLAETAEIDLTGWDRIGRLKAT